MGAVISLQVGVFSGGGSRKILLCKGGWVTTGKIRI